MNDRLELALFVPASLAAAALCWSVTRPAPIETPHDQAASAPEAGQPGFDLAGLPLYFEADRGQLPDGADFVARAPRAAVLLAADRAVVAPRGGRASFTVELRGADAAAPGEALEALPGRANYLTGDRDEWVTDVPLHGRVRYDDVYPGVDVEYYGNGGELEFDFVVEPGADPSAVRLGVPGVTSVEDDGSLRLRNEDGVAQLRAPVVYQEVDGRRESVASRYVMRGRGEVGIEVDAYDTTAALVVDPVLSYSSYIGTADTDGATSVHVAASGDVYVVGSTTSSAFPTFGSVQGQKGDSNGARTDGFVMRFDPDLLNLRYSTYLGGDDDDACVDAAEDSAGRLYVIGDTDSSDFPTSGGGNAFTLRLSAAGDDYDEEVRRSGFGRAIAAGGGDVAALFESSGSVTVYRWDDDTLQSTQITVAGSASTGHDVAIDGAGTLFVAGGTDLTTIATGGAYQTAHGGGTDGFVYSRDSGGTVVRTTYLGGSGDDVCRGLALDGVGNVWVAGETDSTNLPTTSPAQGSNAGGLDAFVAQLDDILGAATFVTYLGGSDDDFGTAVTVDTAGMSYVVGGTASSDFPTTTGSLHGGGDDAFVARYTSSGVRAASRFFGGSDDESASSVEFGDGGRAIVCGTTDSSDMPLGNSHNGGEDGFLASFKDSTATTLSVDSLTLQPWTAGLPYPPQQLTRRGGTGPFTWSVASGDVPPGLTLGTDGLLDGTPTTQGNYGFRAKVTDANGRFAVSKTIPIRINGTTTLVTGGIPTWTEGALLDFRVIATGGTAPFTWEVTDGALPFDVLLQSDGGLRGVPETRGQYTFTIRVTDSLGVADEEEYTMNVNPPPDIVDTPLPECTSGRNYLTTFEVASATGTSPFFWQVSAGEAPTDQGVGFTSGVMSGTLKAAGDYAFTLSVTDGSGTVVEREFTMTVNAHPQIITPRLPLGAQRRPYASGLRLSGGTAPFIWQVTSGAPPQGLLLGFNTGDLTGTPGAPGDYVLSVRCTDACGATVEGTFDIAIAGEFDVARRKAVEVVEFGPVDQMTPLRYLFDLTEATAINITARILRSPTKFTEFDIKLLDNEENEVAIDGFAKTKGKSFRLRNLRVAETGRYFIVFTPPEGFEGRLKVQAKPKAQTKFTGTVSVGGPNPIQSGFAVGIPGSKVTVSSKPSKKSFATPVINLIRVDENSSAFKADFVKRKGRNRTYKFPDPLQGLDIEVLLGALAGTRGDIDWTVKIKPQGLYDFTLPTLVSGRVIDP